MSASQATLQMEDTHGAEKARAKHLGVNSPERSPPRKVKWTHLVDPVRKTWAL